jgi:uncharacterized membrane protein YhaH (DUF805 family)
MKRIIAGAMAIVVLIGMSGVSRAEIAQTKNEVKVSSMSEAEFKSENKYEFRLTRTQYWLRQLAAVGGIIVGGVLSAFGIGLANSEYVGSGLLAVAAGLAILGYSAVFSVQTNTGRLHDMNMSGWYQLAGLIPVSSRVLSPVVPLALGFVPSIETNHLFSPNYQMKNRMNHN